MSDADVRAHPGPPREGNRMAEVRLEAYDWAMVLSD
ncbi:hypothetical protein BCL57_000090 [Agromyces flavus]|uniref:Uncharacterized protein n=1 Tax=Agromyces flavus TaxID=589382 RepID=A0A1H1VJ85_9MICO|nr:hypothetical protein [Agromyces flavus]SDS84785.1 hypothetical protein SAMN04489721_2022 [Agromyces flavus]